MNNTFIIILILGCFALAALWFILKLRNIDIWFFSYLKQVMSIRKSSSDTKHIYVCLADHYEPYFGGAEQAKARDLVSNWVTKYREIAKKHTDSDGNHPKHSYFYPAEEYDEWVLDELKSISEEDLGDVEIHLHHDDDTEENLTQSLNEFKNILFKKHNLLRKDSSGEIVYGFIHGNWSLANSRPDGKWCGVDNELDVLLKTGCRYDMTMPSAPSDTQTKKINSIYFAPANGQCKSHDTGRDVSTSSWGNDNELLMIQGPLSLNWKDRKLGLVPRVDAGELSYDVGPNMDRIKLWESCGVSIKGEENHIFVKLYTHGLQEKNMKMFFDLGGFDKLWSLLEEQYKGKNNYKLHYVTAWSMYEKIKKLAGV